mmetsp:Transcript_32548/g.96180  ORF Transcript_32548/g.96180 Transcript_32548/m.96180 type:complete len:218 (+) Transcript_32548:981-1634(+)
MRAEPSGRSCTSETAVPRLSADFMSEYDVSAMMISRQGPPPSYARTRLASSVARRPRCTPSRPSAPPWTGCGAGSTRPRAPPPAERGGGVTSRGAPGGPQCFRTNSGRDTGCCCCCRCCGCGCGCCCGRDGRRRRAQRARGFWRRRQRFGRFGERCRCGCGCRGGRIVRRRGGMIACGARWFPSLRWAGRAVCRRAPRRAPSAAAAPPPLPHDCMSA